MHLSVLKTVAGIANLAEISAFQSVIVADVCSKLAHDVWSVLCPEYPMKQSVTFDLIVENSAV